MKRLLILFSILGLAVSAKAGDIYTDGHTNDGHIIQEEGVSLAQTDYLNFVGSTSTCATSAGKTVCTFTGSTADSVLPTTPSSEDCLIGRDGAGDSGCYTSFNILSSSINWTNLQEIQSADINWTSLNQVVQPSGINWGSIQQIQTGDINWTSLDQHVLAQAINWTDIQALNGAGMGGRVNSKEVNINMANPSTGLAVVWRNMTGMVYNLTKLFGNATASSQAVLLYATGDVSGGVNWVDVQTIGTLNINQTSGTVDGVNWSATKDLQTSDINWTTIENYGNIAINWTSGAPTDANIGLQGYLTGAGK